MHEEAGSVLDDRHQGLSGFWITVPVAERKTAYSYAESLYRESAKISILWQFMGYTVGRSPAVLLQVVIQIVYTFMQ